VVGRAVETVARRHGIAGVRTAVERPTLAWLTEIRRSLTTAALSSLAGSTDGKWAFSATDRQAGATSKVGDWTRSESWKSLAAWPRHPRAHLRAPRK